MDPSRRKLLIAGAGFGAGAAFPAPSTPPPGEAEDGLEPAFRISLAQWSLHRALFAGRLDPLDFPHHAALVHGIHAVEYVNTFYRERAADFVYLGELKQRADDSGVRSLLIMVDGEGNLGAADDDARRRAVENHFKWIAAARFLGCHSIRVNAAGEGPADLLRARCADSLRRLAVFGEDYDLNVIVENHGGLSSNGAWLASVMRAADHPRVGTLPDFGNFQVAPPDPSDRSDHPGEWYDRYQGVAELMPFAKAVSAKSHEFDDAGDELRTDYRRMLGIVLDAGYHGWIGVEYEGDAHSEDDGIRLTKDLLLKLRDERT